MLPVNMGSIFLVRMINLYYKTTNLLVAYIKIVISFHIINIGTLHCFIHWYGFINFRHEYCIDLDMNTWILMNVFIFII
jgi:hypothetical protein